MPPPRQKRRQIKGEDFRLRWRQQEPFLDDLKVNIDADPTVSMRRHAKNFKVSRRPIERVVHDDLGLKSYACTPWHLLAASLKEKQLEKCQKILNYLRHHAPTMKIFSDKKIVAIDQVYNRRNDRWLVETTEGNNGVFWTKNPARLMALGVLASDARKMPPSFFKPGEKINADVH